MIKGIDCQVWNMLPPEVDEAISSHSPLEILTMARYNYLPFPLREYPFCQRPLYPYKLQLGVGLFSTDKCFLLSFHVSPQVSNIFATLANLFPLTFY